MSEIISSFRGKYAFLSNFHKCRIIIDDIEYPSSENAYQALKFDDIDVRKAIAEISPGKAKKFAQLNAPRNIDNGTRLSDMFRILIVKFVGNSELMAKLLDTGQARLVEGNDWGDSFFGVDAETGRGQNHLGELLMLIRDGVLNSKLSPQ